MQLKLDMYEQNVQESTDDNEALPPQMTRQKPSYVNAGAFKGLLSPQLTSRMRVSVDLTPVEVRAQVAFESRIAFARELVCCRRDGQTFDEVHARYIYIYRISLPLFYV